MALDDEAEKKKKLKEIDLIDSLRSKEFKIRTFFF